MLDTFQMSKSQQKSMTPPWSIASQSLQNRREVMAYLQGSPFLTDYITILNTHFGQMLTTTNYIRTQSGMLVCSVQVDSSVAVGGQGKIHLCKQRGTSKGPTWVLAINYKLACGLSTPRHLAFTGVSHSPQS